MRFLLRRTDGNRGKSDPNLLAGIALWLELNRSKSFAVECRWQVDLIPINSPSWWPLLVRKPIQFPIIC